MSRSTDFEAKEFRPIFYCTEKMNVVDINDAARESDFSKYIDENMEKYLCERDISELKYSMFCKKNSHTERDYHCIVKLQHMRSLKYAFVRIKSFFGKYFYEMHIFQSSADMFRNFSVAKMMMSEPPFAASYKLSRNRVEMEIAAENINRAVVSNFLTNLYFTANDEMEKPQIFDVVETVRRMVIDIAKRLSRNPSEFDFEFEDRSPFVYPIISLSNFVNITALLIILTGRLSENKKVKVSVISESERASVLFKTLLRRADVDVIGGFSFEYIGIMFPKYEAYVSAVKYICELFGLRCYASIEGKRELSVELVLAEAPPDIEIHCMHNENKFDFDMSANNVLLLAERLEGISADKDQ